MTELQVTIENLKEVLTGGNRLLFKLEKAQKGLEKPKLSVFPSRFIVVADQDILGEFLIGLEKPATPGTWRELPKDFSGRACFSKNDVRQIITGLQTLLGESNG